MLAQGQSSSAKRGGLVADVSSGLIFLKKEKKIAWWPIVLTVRDGLLISSIIYRIRRDGRAIRIRMMAGKIVQIVSTS